jgi:hypothetical protein
MEFQQTWLGTCPAGVHACPNIGQAALVTDATLRASTIAGYGISAAVLTPNGKSQAIHPRAKHLHDHQQQQQIFPNPADAHAAWKALSQKLLKFSQFVWLCCC